MVHEGPRVFIWRSQVMCQLDNQAIKILVQSVIDEMRQFRGIVIATVADNVRNFQLALIKLTLEPNGIFQVRSIAHVINLMQVDVFRRINLAKQALKDVEKFIEVGDVGRYVVTRWNSRYIAIQKALSKNLGISHFRIRWEQLGKILKHLAEQQMVLQRDHATLIDVIRVFLSMRTAWKKMILPVQTSKTLLNIWKDQWALFLDSTFGSAVKCAKHLILVCTNEEEMTLFDEATQDDQTLFKDWCFARVSANKKDELESDFKRLKQFRNLGISMCKGTCSVLETCVDLIAHNIVVSEAAVERAFSRHRLIHTRFRSQLSQTRLEDSLFVCYYFKRILKISSEVSAECLAISDEENYEETTTDIEYDETTPIFSMMALSTRN